MCFKVPESRSVWTVKGRAIDNVCIERFWRTIKYDEVYLKDYVNMKEAKREIGNFIRKYNEERPHESLGGLTPIMLYDKVKTITG